MTTLTVSDSPVRILPTRVEIRAMMTRPSVFISVVAAGLIAFLSTLGAVLYLVAHDKPTDAITWLIGSCVFGGAIKLIDKLNQVHKAITTTKDGGNNGSQ